MGVNISIDVPGWDAFANGGMKAIMYDPVKFPKLYRPSPLGGDPGDYNDDFRPADFALWRKSLVELNCNVKMWLAAMGAMEVNPDLWAAWSN
jgi:hypothetical protein